MKIVQINTVSSAGSIGKICMSLYQLAEHQHMVPCIAYGRGTAPKNIYSYKIGSKPDFYCHVLRNFIMGENGFGSSRQTVKFINWLRNAKPDIIHLHNIHGFYLNIEILFRYLKESNTPIVWTLHDCWPFTGHCAYFSYIKCSKWKTGCHSCAQHRNSYPYSIFKDNSKASYLRKKNIFTNVPNLTIVTPSYWLSRLVSQSFLRDYPCIVIPNGIDLDKFNPGCKPDNNKFQTHYTVLGVANVWEPRKGLHYFEQLACRLPDNYNITLVGLSQKQMKYLNRHYAKKITACSRTSSIEELASLYQKAYVFVNPTLEDNFPTTNLEALACGTPVITFDTGGSPECINNTCGKVVPKGDTNGLMQAILSLENAPLITAENCRKQAMSYSEKESFLKYIDLYCMLAGAIPEC